VDAREIAASDEDRYIDLRHVRALVSPELVRDWRSPVHLIHIFDAASRVVCLDDELCDEVEIRHIEHASSTELFAVDAP
jgi:hypothetical protein